MKADTIVLLRRQYSYTYINVLILFNSLGLYFLDSNTFICPWKLIPVTNIYFTFTLKEFLMQYFSKGRTWD